MLCHKLQQEHELGWGGLRILELIRIPKNEKRIWVNLEMSNLVKSLTLLNMMVKRLLSILRGWALSIPGLVARFHFAGHPPQSACVKVVFLPIFFTIFLPFFCTYMFCIRSSIPFLRISLSLYFVKKFDLYLSGLEDYIYSIKYVHKYFFQAEIEIQK